MRLGDDHTNPLKEPQMQPLQYWGLNVNFSSYVSLGHFRKLSTAFLRPLGNYSDLFVERSDLRNGVDLSRVCIIAVDHQGHAVHHSL